MQEQHWVSDTISFMMTGVAAAPGFQGEWFAGKVGWWDETVYLFTEQDQGRTELVLGTEDAAPGNPGPEWEDVVELSVVLNEDEALSVVLYSDEVDEVELTPAAGHRLWGLRLSALGRDLGPVREDETNGERYEILAWPVSETFAPRVLRLGSDAVHRAIENPTGASDDDAEEEWDDEAEEAEQARRMEEARRVALRIGDVDAQGSARASCGLSAEFRNLFLGGGEGGQIPPVEDLYPGGLLLPHDPEDFEADFVCSIATGFALGDALVFAEALTTVPAEVEAGWQDVAEVSILVGNGPLEVYGDEGPSDADTEADEPDEPDDPEIEARLPRLDREGPGWYRVRVHGVNRALLADEVAHGEPVERYLVQAWKDEGPRELRVLRQETVDGYEADDTPARVAPYSVPTVPGWVPAPGGPRKGEDHEGWDEGQGDEGSAGHDASRTRIIGVPQVDISPELLERYLLSVELSRGTPLDVSDPAELARARFLAWQEGPEVIEEVIALLQQDGGGRRGFSY